MADKIKPFKVGCCANPYPTAYDETLSYYEEVCKIAYKLNEVINSQNNIVTSFEQILEWVNTQLKSYTIEQLQNWLDDGTLANMIANMLNLYRFYDTTLNLLSDSTIQSGQFYSTSGYASINDGYGALWYVSDSQNNNMIQLQAGNLYLNLILNGKFNSKQIGDSITDLDYLFPRIIKSNMDIVINNLTLNVTYDTTAYTVENIKIDLTGSIIQAKTPYNATTAQLLGFNNSTNIEIKGGSWNANRDQNTAINVNREQCHGLDFHDCDQVKVTNATIYNCCGDGIQFGSQERENYVPKSIEIGYCDISNCYRNGISILDCKNAYIHDCQISNITDDPLNPVDMPMCSIDFEPFFVQQTFKNVHVENVYSLTPGGFGIFAGTGENNFSFINCSENSIKVNKYFSEDDTTVLNVKIEKLNLRYLMTINDPCNIDFDVYFNNYNATYNCIKIKAGDGYNIKGKAIFGKALQTGNTALIILNKITNSTCLIETNTKFFRNNNTNDVYIITSAITTSIATSFGNIGNYAHKYGYKQTASASSIQPADENGLYQPLTIYCNNTFQLSDATGGQLTCNVALPATINKGSIIYISYPSTNTVLCHILK
nr:MAG TPA: Protein of unknown function (DUF3737) [Caudoviricetes sp.]